MALTQGTEILAKVLRIVKVIPPEVVFSVAMKNEKARVALATVAIMSDFAGLMKLELPEEVKEVLSKVNETLYKLPVNLHKQAVVEAGGYLTKKFGEVIRYARDYRISIIEKRPPPPPVVLIKISPIIPAIIAGSLAKMILYIFKVGVIPRTLTALVIAIIAGRAFKDVEIYR